MVKTLVFMVTTDLNHDQRMQRIATSLAKAGFEVTLVGRLLPNSYTLEKQSYKQYRFKCYFVKGPLFYLEFNLRLLIWFFSNRFELYGVIDTDTALAGMMASCLYQRPLIYDAHELFPEMPEVVNRPVVKKVWTVIEKLAFKRAGLTYTVSESLVQYFQGKYGGKVGLVRNMPTKKISHPTPTDPPYLVYQGALNVGRGLECTIAALQQVPVRLVICGDGPLKSRLHNLAIELGVQDRVIFKGNLPPGELAFITASAWAGIMLLENQGLSYYYSLANKFFDYVQAGIPQVCVPFPEYRHLNTQYEVALFSETRTTEIISALLALVHDQELYQRLQQNCLYAREEWCWEKEEKQLLALYAPFK